MPFCERKKLDVSILHCAEYETLAYEMKNEDGKKLNKSQPLLLLIIAYLDDITEVM